MDAQPTCGAGLAENSALPSNLAKVTEAMANVLEMHEKSLDPTDAHSRAELEVYQEVATALRSGARHLSAAANRMAASKAMPMGKHDFQVLASPPARDAFAQFVGIEEKLSSLFREWLERDRRMLAAMQRPSSS